MKFYIAVFAGEDAAEDEFVDKLNPTDTPEDAAADARVTMDSQGYENARVVEIDLDELPVVWTSNDE